MWRERLRRGPSWSLIWITAGPCTPMIEPRWVNRSMKSRSSKQRRDSSNRTSLATSLRMIIVLMCAIPDHTSS